MVRLGSLLAAVAVLLSGCLYGFTGGGLPRHIRTVAIEPFDNDTPEAGLTTEVHAQLQEEIPRSLGVRLVDEQVADAVIRGRITRFDEPPPVIRPPGPGGQVEAVQGQIRITVDAEIYDIREDRALWQGRGLGVVGNYLYEGEQRQTGQLRAVQELVRRIIEGAQSQW